MLNEHSWNKNANVLYVEQPAFVGFSVGKEEDKVTNDDIAALDNVQAMVSFFEKFPQFRANELFVSGESWAGVYVPTTSHQIHLYN